MDDSADEAGGQSQVHVCSSYPLSFPSQPPDIKNWFSSYVYDSPEVPELVADNDGGNGSETQDPFEHSSLKHSHQDGGVALRESCLGVQSEPEIFSGKYLVPVDGNAMKPATKRKQSLRALFGASFLDGVEEANETDSHGLFPVQLNALKHVSDCTSLPLNEVCEAHLEKKNFTSLLDTTRHSQEGTAEHSKVLVDCDRISSVETQESTPVDLEAEIKKSADCDDACLADIEKGFAEDDIHHVELPFSFNSTILAGTEKKFQVVDNSTSFVSRRACLVASPNTPCLTVAATTKTLLFGSHLKLACHSISSCPLALHSCLVVCGRGWQECGERGEEIGRRGCGESGRGRAKSGPKPNIPAIASV